MSSDKFARLEELVNVMIGEMRHLQSENDRLAKEIRTLQKNKAHMEQEELKIRDTLNRLNQLEIAAVKMEKDRSIIRSRVENLLEQLEKVDFA